MPIAVKSDREEQFEVLFKEHGRLVYRTAYGVTGRHEDAEDVLQSIFLQLVRREFPPDLQNNPEAYLYRAAVNSSLNILRRRRQEVLLGTTEHFDVLMCQKDEDVTEVQIKGLYEAIGELKPDWAEILILRYMHNKSDAEIARMLGRSRGTIALKLFRSRARLRKILLAKSRS